MEILKRVSVPTGDILVVKGSRGKLEMLSLGDYGKAVNLKCDAMGLSRSIEKVEHTKLLPLEEKWVLTISTQYGCSMNCQFCDVHRVGKGVNATLDDLTGQVWTGLNLHPEVTKTERLNIHFARMGEPTWNPAVLDAARYFKPILGVGKIHPVVSTMMPRHNEWLPLFIREWLHIKNKVYDGEAGLQLSINSTNNAERRVMFRGNAHTLQDIAAIMAPMPFPCGRKITLNFALAHWEIDPDELARYFSPDRYIIKLTPMHVTKGAMRHGIVTAGDYTTGKPYEVVEEALKSVGYDVLVFVASTEEDESRITCGHAILADNPEDWREYGGR